ncbi:transposase [Streptomyces sp. CA-210063]|uniref:transposase n=1 Tax=Streptomyces sp. CA-210063 TaxID=2801029 RepID=UPI003FA703E0
MAPGLPGGACGQDPPPQRQTVGSRHRRCSEPGAPADVGLGDGRGAIADDGIDDGRRIGPTSPQPGAAACPLTHRFSDEWWDGIESYLTSGITNAAPEGLNHPIKPKARSAFGFRNLASQRLRSRCATTDRSRREAHSSDRTTALARLAYDVE